jgi:branched-chain amino acid transport system ATP-binding protein
MSVLPATPPVSLNGTEPLLELVSVRAGYGPIEVLHGVDLVIPRGALVALLGPNGGGKSTTLRVCCGLVPVNSGELRLAGKAVNGAAAHDLARLGVCTIPEGRGIFANLSVRENLWLATGTGVSRDKVESVAFEHFPRLGERRNQLAGTLSGGEQQMLAISRALATDPTVLILDELSMGLAPLVVSSLYETVAELARAGLSILVAEQFAQTVLPLAQSAAIMLQGRIARTGDPSAIEEELASAYLGG